MDLFFEEELTLMLMGLVSGIPAAGFHLVTYVFTALALYTVAQRRGIRNAWLSWIPVVNCWILGSLSDQYRYVVRGEVKNKRKSLLVLHILISLAELLVVILGILALVGFLNDDYSGFFGPLMGLGGVSLLLCGLAIAYAIVRFMALYDVYKSLDPDNAVLFLVLSILVQPTEAFFLFFSRQKDQGMPPRRTPDPQPVWDAENPM